MRASISIQAGLWLFASRHYSKAIRSLILARSQLPIDETSDEFCKSQNPSLPQIPIPIDPPLHAVYFSKRVMNTVSFNEFSFTCSASPSSMLLKPCGMSVEIGKISTRYRKLHQGIMPCILIRWSGVAIFLSI